MRPTEWKRLLWSDLQVDPAPTGDRLGEVILIDQASIAALTRPTLVRTHLRMSLLALTHETGLLATGAIGVTPVDLAEATPCPLASSNSSRWMLWWPFQLYASDPRVDGFSHQQLTFDIRSMRKLDDSMSVVMVIELNTTATASVICHGGVSALLKE